MDKSNNDINNDLDLLYREYVRLSNRLDAIIEGSWNDFKLLGAIGALIAWPPIAQSDLFIKSEPGLILFVGFAGILFIISVIGVRDLIKQSIMQHYMFELQLQEEDMRTKLQNASVASLQFFGHWLNHRVRAYQGILSRFYLLFYLFLFFFPAGVLVIKGAWPYAIAYGITLLVSLAIYLDAARLLAGWKQLS